MQAMSLESLFKPKSIAIIGASADPAKIGHSVISNLIQAGYQGAIYPVNPKAENILGLKVSNNISSLPNNLDLAVLTIPRQYVFQSLQDLAQIHTRSVIIITAGFKEVDKEGYLLEEQIVELAQKNDISVLGPNCLGIINTSEQINVTFAAGTPSKGNIAFFSQSGALCQAILDWALGKNIGFSKFISLGNKAVLNEADMLRYLAHDSTTDVILGYIENVTNGQDFLQQAQIITDKKPVLLIKSGTSAAGAKAASSHTGAIAGSDQAYKAAFEKCGVIRIKDVSTLFTLAQAFATQPLPNGPNVAIVTNSGGPGIMAADACENANLHLAKLSESTVKSMQEFLPAFASLYNPVDIIGDANAQRYLKTLDIVSQDPNIDSLLIVLTPTASIVAEIQAATENIIKIAQNTTKPVLACFMGDKAIGKGIQRLQEAGVPCYPFPEPAVQCLETMYKYSQWQQRKYQELEYFHVDKYKAEKVIKKAQEKRKGDESIEIVEFQAQELLKAYDLPTPKTAMARTSKEAVQQAKKIGFPVVLKIASMDISHKSDVEGVKVGISNEEEVKQSFIEITSRTTRLRPQAHIMGCLVQKMAPKDVKEVIIGFKRDEQFGPLLMFGLGGIYVEVLKDISFKLAPVTRQEANDMIRRIKSYMLLTGIRGESAANIQAIENIILKMSQLAMDIPEITEAEFNPVLVNEEQAIVADVRLTL